MKLIQHNKHIIKRLTFFAIGFLLLILNTTVIMAEIPPTPVVGRPLLFGNFINNVSSEGTGTITMSADASSNVTASSGIILLNSAPRQSAIVTAYYTKHTSYHSVTVTFDPSVYLKNGTSYSVQFTPSPTTPNNSFNFNNSKNDTGSIDIYIGGTLTVGSPSVNPAGSYSGQIKVYLTYNN
ncbi:MAG: DUF4402 domain-containing protein [Bacteroidota bacterium]|nr:DUF4402 domain-containing protein [Bacteroidota bacterium]